MIKKRLIQSIFISSLKVIASIASYAHIFFIAKVLSKEDSGFYFASYNIIILTSVIFTFGLNTLLAKNLPILKEQQNIKKTYLALLMMPVVAISSIALPFYFFNLPMHVSTKDTSIDIYPLIFTITAAAISSISLGALQGRYQVISFIFAQAILPLSPIFLYLLFFEDKIFNASWFLTLLSIGYVLSVAFCLYKSRTILALNFNISPLIDKIKEAKDFWLLQVSQIGMFTGASVIAAHNLSLTEFSDFTVFSRLAAIVGFVAIATNISLAPRISELLSQNKIDELKIEILHQNRINTFFGFLALIIIILFSNVFLSYIDKGPIASLLPLYIMAGSQAVVIIFGPIAPMMSMLKLEQKYMVINIILLPVSLILIYFASKNFNILGAAIVFSSIMLLQNFICYRALKHKYSFIKTL